MATLFTGPLIDSLVDELIPDHVQGSYPKYVEFIKSIAKYLEEESRSGFMVNRVARQRDIDLVEEEFLTELQNEIGSAVPRGFAANPRLFYRKLGDLYRSRGTPGSIEAFFRLLYNDNVELYFPKDDLFKPSDGTWFSFRDDLIANPGNYDPTFTFTANTSQSIVSGLDDAGVFMTYDHPEVYVDNVYQVLGTDYNVATSIDDINDRLIYEIVFTTPMTGGEIVDIYETELFSTVRSFPSDTMKLQDSFFYQKFSYVIRTGTDSNLWRNAYNRLIHPAGFIFFSEIFIIIEVLGGIFPEIQPGWQTYGAPVQLIPTNNPVPAYIRAWNVEPVIVIEPDQTNAFGAAQWLEQIKFYLHGGMGGFGEYTIQEAIELRLPFNMDAEITIS